MSTCACVLSKNGERLMPTIRLGKVRHLLKDGKAKIVKHHPFTIQLLYDGKTNTQPIEICEDVGYNYIGISVKSQSHEYVSAQYDTRRTKTMNEFKARSTLGSEAVPVFDDDGELTEWLHRDNYTVEELELMNFVGDEKPVIKKDGVKIIRDGTVIRRANTETRKTEFLFIPRIVTSEQKTV